MIFKETMWPPVSERLGRSTDRKICRELFSDSFLKLCSAHLVNLLDSNSSFSMMSLEARFFTDSRALQWITMDNHGYPFGFWICLDKWLSISDVR
jgi:hypothetical protein